MQEIPILSSEEIRVLGALIEKSKTTPDYYPMTLNAITLACNQKSSRHPVVEFEEETVQKALSNLKAMSLVATAVGAGTRTIKYKHNFTTLFPLPEAQLAIMCLLFLRGALTPGEINSSSARLHEFSSSASVLENILSLSQGDLIFVKELSKKSGQKENRFVHTFGEYIESNDVAESHEIKSSKLELEKRIEELEVEVKELKEKVNKLYNEFYS